MLSPEYKPTLHFSRSAIFSPRLRQELPQAMCVQDPQQLHSVKDGRRNLQRDGVSSQRGVVRAPALDRPDPQEPTSGAAHLLRALLQEADRLPLLQEAGEFV